MLRCEWGISYRKRKRTIMNRAIFVASFSLAESASAATTFAHDHMITYITNRARMTSDFSGYSVIILYTIFTSLCEDVSVSEKGRWRSVCKLKYTTTTIPSIKRTVQGYFHCKNFQR